jgi:hypothetical protein
MRKSLGLLATLAAALTVLASAQPAAATHFPNDPNTPPWGYVAGDGLGSTSSYPYEFIFSSHLTDPPEGAGGFTLPSGQFVGGETSCMSIQGSKATVGFWNEEQGTGVMLTVFDAEADPAHNFERYPELYLADEGYEQFYDMLSDLVLVDSRPTDCDVLLPMSFRLFDPSENIQVHIPPTFKNGSERCGAERNWYGAERFRSAYGGGKNAYGKCVSSR